MNERTRLTHAVRARLDRFARTGDPATVTGLDALAEAATLFRLAPSEAELIGQLFWARFTVRAGTPAGDADLSTAFTIAELLSGGVPEAMPGYLREGLPRYRFSVGVYARANRGRQQEALAHAEQVVLREPSRRTAAEVRRAADDCCYALRYISLLAPGCAEALSVKGLALLARYEHERDGALLAEAELVRRETLAIRELGTAGHAGALFDLLACLRMCWRHDPDPAVSGECAELGRQLCRTAVPDPAVRLTVWFHGGQTLRHLAAESGDAVVGAVGADLLRAAVQTAHEQDEPGVWARTALAYVQALRDMHRLTGDLDWLWRAVVAARDAVAAARPGRPERPALLGTLCAVLLDHAELEPYSTNVVEAVDAGEEACATVAPGDPERGRYLHELARALLQAASRGGDSAVAGRAVAVAEEAAAAVAPEDPARWVVMLLLGGALHRRWSLGGNPDDLTRAVRVTRDAVAVLTPSAPERAVPLGNLALFLRLLAAQEDGTERLREALEAARAAVVPGRPCGSARLVLGRILQDLHGRGDAGPGEIVEARDAFASALAADDLSPSWRITAARGLAWAHLTAGEPAEALAACEAALALLPRASSMLMWRGDRQRHLAGTAGLAAEAASAAVAAGRAGRAVELLELARGTLLAETMDRRGLRARIAEAAPDLAEAYDDLLHRVELYDDNPGNLAVIEVDLGSLSEYDRRAMETQQMPSSGGRAAGFSMDRVYADLQGERHRTEEALAGLLQRARSRPGLADLLLPPNEITLRRQATEGPIVMVNASRYRGDALLVTVDGVRDVPLPGVDEETAGEQSTLLADALQRIASGSLGERRDGQRAIAAVFGWLWDRIAEPILDTLGHTGSPAVGAPWPRVWWCPVGTLTPLPLHAAGHHTDGSGRSVLDRVVSGYTPTIRALRHARSVPAEAPGTSRMLIVAVPGPRGGTGPALHRVLAEAEGIRHLVPSARVLGGAAARHDTVSRALRDHGLVHFACHYLTDAGDPEAGTLVLDDHDDVPLTVLAVSKEHLPGAALAYLSACDTIRSTRTLHDEAVHAASAFHLAGYRHVIGTLWPVNDGAAAEISDAFYAGLTNGGTRPPAAAEAGTALHDAVRGLRERCGGRSPSLWAAHVHAGP